MEAPSSLSPKPCPHAQELREHLRKLDVVARLFKQAKKHRRTRLVRSEQWLCLYCCSRHCAATDAGHALGVSLRDLSVFCDTCAAFVSAPVLVRVVSLLKRALFRSTEADSPKKKFKALKALLSKPAIVLPSPPEPRILTDHSIEAFANYIKENGCKNILVLTGAGLSTSAGIPDFRTPGTGLYDNLEKYKLPTPQSIFDIDFFRRNPEPFYLLARELYPGNFKPTLGHLFIRLLAERGMLLRNFTQNIDTLERVAGIPDQFLVEAHGSFATASCVGRETFIETIDAPPLTEESPATQIVHPDPARTPLVRGCGAKYTQEWVRNKIMAHETPTCLNPLCDPHSLVKPDITFFGEPLPRRFFDCVRTDFAHADAVIVMGSSLKVSPFAMLPLMFGARVPRLLINREVVGNFDATNGKDTLFLGGCDEGCLRLANLLGFKDELLEAYRAFS